MYLFTSAIFFLVLFSITKTGAPTAPKALTAAERQEWKSVQEAVLLSDPSNENAIQKLRMLNDTSYPVYNSDMLDLSLMRLSNGKRYRSVHDYDSIQRALPPGERDSWIRKKITRRMISLNERYRGMEQEGNKVIGNYILHQFPYMLFLSLPFFALILKLVYVRRKDLYYSDHAIFTLFHYILSFLLLLFLFAFNELEDLTGWEVFNLMILGMILAWLIYFLLELKYFYRQGWGKTILKFIIINFLGITLLTILLLIFFFLSLFQI